MAKKERADAASAVGERSALAVAEGLKAEIAGIADQIEADRQLPESLVSALKARGALRFLIPSEVGGAGVALPDFISGLQTFAEADASTAWCVSQGAVIATTTLWLGEDVLREFWADPEMAVANGPPRGCTATPIAEGYRVNGDWGFSSGCQHATWMHGAVRREEDDVWLGVFFPKTAATFNDNWRTAGLCGTGSFEFAVRELEVPDDHVVDFRQPPTIDDPLTRLPVGLIFAVSFASVALGVARGGLDAAVAIAQGKVPAYSSTTVRDDPDMQKILAEAECDWRAARAYLHETVNNFWSALADQDRASDQQRIDLRMAGTHTLRMAAASLDKAYTIAGSTAIYRDNPLQRRFQDMHTITQHVQARLGHYGYMGRYLFGHPFKPGPLN
jgi:alkylation response protein AidB-like acyl-CoA dehydrogenase